MVEKTKRELIVLITEIPKIFCLIVDRLIVELILIRIGLLNLMHDTYQPSTSSFYHFQYISVYSLDLFSKSTFCTFCTSYIDKFVEYSLRPSP